jgi:hypothetical protein
MPLLSVPAHYDGQHILLDEPVQLPIGRRLLVTVLDEVDDRSDFHRLAENGLAAAYGSSEPEYTEADLHP